MITINKVKARTEKSCEYCPKRIKVGTEFVRLGFYPNDKTFHSKCIMRYSKDLSKELRRLHIE